MIKSICWYVWYFCLARFLDAVHYVNMLNSKCTLIIASPNRKIFIFSKQMWILKQTFLKGWKHFRGVLKENSGLARLSLTEWSRIHLLLIDTQVKKSLVDWEQKMLLTLQHRITIARAQRKKDRECLGRKHGEKLVILSANYYEYQHWAGVMFLLFTLSLSESELMWWRGQKSKSGTCMQWGIWHIKNRTRCLSNFLPRLHNSTKSWLARICTTFIETSFGCLKTPPLTRLIHPFFTFKSLEIFWVLFCRSNGGVTILWEFQFARSMCRSNFRVNKQLRASSSSNAQLSTPAQLSWWPAWKEDGANKTCGVTELFLSKICSHSKESNDFAFLSKRIFIVVEQRKQNMILSRLFIAWQYKGQKGHTEEANFVLVWPSKTTRNCQLTLTPLCCHSIFLVSWIYLSIWIGSSKRVPGGLNAYISCQKPLPLDSQPWGLHSLLCSGLYNPFFKGKHATFLCTTVATKYRRPPSPQQQ